ncbi:spindle pole body-associated protein sad1 [Stemphylium lycopersici]|uniref:Spindle pole body-associated protein sad1 n=1 Tax=Stemphylium lycopersici TaxID=183478 RepID=A0A364ND14_STELY|nr:spindle pole body-associated protein sad1 [Stemphylium lycopersici]RAR15215.1 spindle pole body-associated protein sad1 [Stemphylium lycopersici]
MSQRANTGAPTPSRRSGRLSTRASSAGGETAVTTATASGTVKRNKTTLTQVKARRSNAYGASGRVGNPDKLPAAPTTGFAQAFKHQLNKSGIQETEEEEEEENEGEEIDELGGAPQSEFFNQSRHTGQSSPTNSRNTTSKSKATPGYSFMESDDFSPSEDDLAASVGNTSKSFGLSHEAGMLVSRDPFASYPIQDDRGSSPFVKPTAPNRKPPARTLNGARSNGPTPAQAPTRTPTQDKTSTPAENGKSTDPGKTSTRANAEHAPVRATPTEIEHSVDALIAEEQARLKRDGLPLPQPQREQDRRRPHKKDPVEVNAWIGDVEPYENEEDEPVWRWRQALTWAFWGLSGCLLVGWVASLMMGASNSESSTGTPGLVNAVGSRVAYTFDRVAEFITPPARTMDAKRQVELEMERINAYKANGEDHFLWGRMSNMEDKWSKRLDEMHATLEVLQEQLPDMLIMRRHNDGSFEISDNFWHALLSKARSNSDPEWASYLEETKEKLRDLFDPTAWKERNANSKPTDTWVEAVTRDEFVHQVEKQYKNITERVDKQLNEAIRAQSAELKVMMKTEAKKTMMDQMRLNALAQANLVANYELHLTKPNYFSPGLGAMIDPDLSSVTFNNKPGRIAGLARRFSWAPVRNPPITALTKWEEPGDCWCSASQDPASPGQAQLAVRLSRPVTPKQVTIEHVPMSMMPARKINNAPRDIELWVQTDAPISPYYSHRQVSCRAPAPESNGGGGWKCLGSFKYNIHASNHLQTFDLAGEPSEPVSRAVLRVTSNWGASHTCLYQVRLHGTDAEKDFEYPVSLMD